MDPAATGTGLDEEAGIDCVAEDSTSCVLLGLQPGVMYRITVTAGNSVGWGQPSDPVMVTTEEPAPTPTILIVGERARINGANGVKVAGATDWIAPGTIMRPWTRFPGQTTYTEGSAKKPVADNGTFTWKRKTNKKIYVFFKTEDGQYKSNRLIIS